MTVRKGKYPFTRKEHHFCDKKFRRGCKKMLLMCVAGCQKISAGLQEKTGYERDAVKSRVSVTEK